MRGQKIVNTHAETLSKLAWTPYGIDGRREVDILPLYDTIPHKHHGSKAALLRYGAGAVVPPHEHLGFELIYIISGTLQDDNGVYECGDCIVYEPQTVHGLWSDGGCVFLVVWEGPVVRTG